MLDQIPSVTLEIPSDIAQEDIWTMERQLRLIEGVEVELQESKDIFAVTLLIISFTVSGITSLAAISENVKAVYDTAKIIYAFLHKKNSDKEDGKRNIILHKKGRKIEIHGLSFEEVEKIIREL